MLLTANTDASLFELRRTSLKPCLSAFADERALPASVRGPVERRHGCQRAMRAAWCARRAGVQPLRLRCTREAACPPPVHPFCKLLIMCRYFRFQ